MRHPAVAGSNQAPPPAPGSSKLSLVANMKHTTVTLATGDAVWEVYLDPKWARQRLRLYGAQDRALEQFFKQHLAAASSAGTSLVANLKHTTVTLATWDAVWEVYLDPKWARQRLRLYGAQDRALEQFFKQLEEDMADVSMERHGRAKQLVMFFGAASIGTGGGWGDDAVLRACCKVVCRPRDSDQLRGRVVLVDEHRTTRVSSAVNGQQPCEEELDHEQPTRRADWKPPAGHVDLRLLRPAWSQQRDQLQPGSYTASSLRARAQHSPPAKRSKRTRAKQAAEPTQPTKAECQGKGKAAKAKPALQPGRWLDRDCNATLNMQRTGESRWRPLELHW
ncbi:hypothetical protein QJQ45_000133 [Haematococcus lacustris]|nr:hypothetical protein QJQ45_000133 [Haematococcus lacustris]